MMYNKMIFNVIAMTTSATSISVAGLCPKKFLDGIAGTDC